MGSCMLDLSSVSQLDCVIRSVAWASGWKGKGNIRTLDNALGFRAEESRQFSRILLADTVCGFDLFVPILDKSLQALVSFIQYPSWKGR